MFACQPKIDGMMCFFFHAHGQLTIMKTFADFRSFHAKHRASSLVPLAKRRLLVSWLVLRCHEIKRYRQWKRLLQEAYKDFPETSINILFDRSIALLASIEHRYEGADWLSELMDSLFVFPRLDVSIETYEPPVKVSVTEFPRWSPPVRLSELALLVAALPIFYVTLPEPIVLEEYEIKRIREAALLSKLPQPSKK